MIELMPYLLTKDTINKWFNFFLFFLLNKQNSKCLVIYIYIYIKDKTLKTAFIREDNSVGSKSSI